MDLLHRLGLGTGRKKWQFQAGELSEETGAFSNPARGWYQIHTFQVCTEPDFGELEWCLNKSDTLAMVLIDIGAYRDRDLDGEALGRICRILDFFGERHYDVILRVVYDREGRAMEREPFFFAQVAGHLRQMGEILQKYASCVFIYQGMLVGNWGEMHTSRFLSEEKMAQMAQILRAYRAGESYLAVRRPVYWRILHPEMLSSGKRHSDMQPSETLCPGDGAGGTVCPGEMGLFDDGIFGSESHLGTFGTTPREAASWAEPWAREDELDFEGELCRYVPNGGEAVYGDAFWRVLTPERVLEELRRMQVTYLNRIHDPRALDIWRQCRCPENCEVSRPRGGAKSVWAGKSIFEYVGAHMGYRFLVRRASVSPGRGAQGLCRVEIEVENTGFAACYQEAEAVLECAREEGEAARRVLSGGLKGWQRGEKRVLVCDVEPCSCELFLWAERKRDGAVIRFANRADEAGRVSLGRICAGQRG